MAAKINWTPEIDAELARLKNSGLTFDEMAKITGYSGNAIRYRMQCTGSYRPTRNAGKDRIEVTCYCCREKWMTDYKGIRKCPYCRKAGHEQSCFEWNALNSVTKKERRVAA